MNIDKERKMKGDKTWYQIYAGEIRRAGGYHKYLQMKVEEKEPFLRRIIRYAAPNGYILEAGCGTGVLSTYLSNRGFRVIATDIDHLMLRTAKNIGRHYSCRPIFKKCDLFNLRYPANFFDVTFSHGVLEHFSDKDIVLLLKIELSISKTVIVSIPCNYFREKDKMFGDERFMSRKKWESLINKTSGSIIERFDFHYQKGIEKLWNSLVRMKLFGPAPYLTFVLQKFPSIS